MKKKRTLTKKYFQENCLKVKGLRRSDPIQFNVLYNEWLRGKLLGKLTK